MKLGFNVYHNVWTVPTSWDGQTQEKHWETNSNYPLSSCAVFWVYELININAAFESNSRCFISVQGHKRDGQSNYKCKEGCLNFYLVQVKAFLIPVPHSQITLLPLLPLVSVSLLDNILKWAQNFTNHQPARARLKATQRPALGEIGSSGVR